MMEDYIWNQLAEGFLHAVLLHSYALTKHLKGTEFVTNTLAIEAAYIMGGEPYSHPSN
jgi:hypothetical protein